MVFLCFFLIVNIITFLSKPFLVTIRAYSITSSAMHNALLIGDRIIVNNAAYGVRNPITNKVWVHLGKPRRGDVAVFIFPQDPSKDYIKRVIGLPGDRIRIINKKVLVNGQPYETPAAVHDDPKVIPPPPRPGDSPRDNLSPVVAPANSYFVLGDNRDYSYDSRFWGLVPFDNMRGKALYVYLSWDRQNSRRRWGRLGQPIN